MKIAFFETKPEERAFFTERLKGHEILFFSGPIQEELTKEADYEAVSVFVHSKITDDVLRKLPKLRYLQTRSTGYDHIKCNTLYKRGILVSNVAGYGGPAVAEFAFSLLLEATRHTWKALRRAKEGIFEYQDLKGIELFGRRLGILGLGTIGSRMAHIGKGFGMEISVWSRTRKPIVDELGLDFTSLERVLETSDVLMIALPLTPATRELIDIERAKLLKEDAIVVNVARGEILQKELYTTLPNVLCLDVTSDLSCVARPNVLYTPHMAYYTKEALRRIMEISCENIEAYIAGRSLPNCLKLSCEKEYGKKDAS
ncbi:NAD(P)-dependent oxidoreductase [Hydrogenimonas cancrithermarum]|uniref:D-glycerate dehydrogenase n=1 Tax=Hydrogenimonas cancrithermarum TaxID=2993563 RepID=A0ABM8FJH1_9BACT|nr:NAD(P)-dependent oxidoreductase [Hydrogenimonas cancrithermarum]BDY11765.1 D-glycerate dehydrogenase [Hydrogenimonas cancrithermarum]